MEGSRKPERQKPARNDKAINAELRPSFSLVLRTASGAMIDYTDARLLRQISEKNSITKAAKEVGISYRNAWDRLRMMHEKLGVHVVDAKAGGKQGGGASLTPEGNALVMEYKHLNDYLLSTLDDKDFWQHIGYRLSARNRIRARIVEVKSGPITSEVRMEIESPGLVSSIITNEAVQDLKLQKGDEVEAIVKATEVVIAKPERALRNQGDLDS